MKKGIWILLTAVFISALIVTSGCTNPDPPNNNGNNTELELISLNEEGFLEQNACSERGLTDKILVFESDFCSACKVAKPRLQEIEQELNATFIYLDLSEAEGQEVMRSFGVIPRYTPTVMVGCQVLIGAKSKEDYKQVIEPFWNSL